MKNPNFHRLVPLSGDDRSEVAIVTLMLTLFGRPMLCSSRFKSQSRESRRTTGFGGPLYHRKVADKVKYYSVTERWQEWMQATKDRANDKRVVIPYLKSISLLIWRVSRYSRMGETWWRTCAVLKFSKTEDAYKFVVKLGRHVWRIISSNFRATFSKSRALDYYLENYNCFWTNK